MPIKKRTLTQLANKGGGLMAWRVNAVDTRGHRYKHGSFVATPAEAEVVRATVEFDTAEEDRRELLTHVQAHGLVADFDFADRDIGLLAGEGFIVRHFAREMGIDVIGTAWWIDGLSNAAFSAIRSRIGFSQAKGNRIRSRAAKLLAADMVFDDVEEV